MCKILKGKSFSYKDNDMYMYDFVMEKQKKNIKAFLYSNYFTVYIFSNQHF